MKYIENTVFVFCVYSGEESRLPLFKLTNFVLLTRVAFLETLCAWDQGRTSVLQVNFSGGDAVFCFVNSQGHLL
jgi:hypothetical protein